MKKGSTVKNGHGSLLPHLWPCFWVFQLTGLGMGFVTLATLVVVQNSVDVSDLGVATSSNQFARTLGGTVGVGICGGFMNSALGRAMDGLIEKNKTIYGGMSYETAQPGYVSTIFKGIRGGRAATVWHGKFLEGAYSGQCPG
ncbi:MAG: hypothetical protein JRD49_12950 [Deltaproteobacteria bacterium]|nr:hypothetical protein [Deltaproteobacteria bacterium]